MGALVWDGLVCPRVTQWVLILRHKCKHLLLNEHKHQNHIHYCMHFFQEILLHRPHQRLFIIVFIRTKTHRARKCRLLLLSWTIQQLTHLQQVCVDHGEEFLCPCKFPVLIRQNWLQGMMVYLWMSIWGQTYLPSGETLGMKEYFKPDGKPAPPLPLRPDFLISSIIQSWPISIMFLVWCQSPLFIAASIHGD